MEIDIRGNVRDCIDSIKFSDSDSVVDNEGFQKGTMKLLDGGNEEFVILYKKDIDNLIKALKKAKELWT